MKHVALCVAVVVLVALAQPASAAVRTYSRVLDQVLPEIRFQGVSIVDAVDFLRDVSGANIHVNWRALEAIGVTKDAQVNMRLRAVTVRKALGLLISEAGGGNQLTFYVDQNVVEVTTRELSDKQLLTRVYPVQDLIMDIPSLQGQDVPAFNLSQSNQSSGRGGGGGGGSLFSGGGGTRNNSSNGNGGVGGPQGRADSLVKLIMDTIQPDIWRENGGPASIRFFNGQLIVTAPRSVHEALGGPID